MITKNKILSGILVVLMCLTMIPMVTFADNASDADFALPGEHEKMPVEDTENLTEQNLTDLKAYLETKYSTLANYKEVKIDKEHKQACIVFNDDSEICHPFTAFVRLVYGKQIPEDFALADDKKLAVKDVDDPTATEIEALKTLVKSTLNEQIGKDEAASVVDFMPVPNASKIEVTFDDLSKWQSPARNWMRIKLDPLADRTEMKDFTDEADKFGVKDVNDVTVKEINDIIAQLEAYYAAKYGAESETPMEGFTKATGSYDSKAGEVNMVFDDGSTHVYTLAEIVKPITPEKTIAEKTSKLTPETKVEVVEIENLTADEQTKVTEMLEAHYGEEAITVEYKNAVPEFGGHSIVVVTFTDTSKHNYYNTDLVVKKDVEKPKTLAEQNNVPGPTNRQPVKNIHAPTTDEMAKLEANVKAYFKDQGFDHVKSVAYVVVGGVSKIRVIFNDDSSTDYEVTDWLKQIDEEDTIASEAYRADLKDLLEDIYARLNDKVNPLTNLEFFNLKLAYDNALEVYNDKTATKARVDKEVNTLKKALGLDLEKPVDRSALNDLVNQAYDKLKEGGLDWNVDYTELRKAYEEALKVYKDNGATQEEIDKQCTNLRKAMGIPEPIKKPLDRSKLDEVIRIAYNKIMAGSETMSINEYNNLKAVYDKAYAVYQDNSATQAQIDNAITSLSRALGINVDTLDGVRPVDRKELGELITKGYNELISGKLSTEQYNNLKVAYDKAYNAYQNSATPQSEINEAAAELRKLLGVIEPVDGNNANTSVGANKSALKNTLDLAYNKLSNSQPPLSQQAFDTIYNAYKKALGVYQKQNATQSEVDQAAQMLKAAMEGQGVNVNVSPTTQIPATGESGLPYLIGMMLVAFCAAAVVLRKKLCLHH